MMRHLALAVALALGAAGCSTLAARDGAPSQLAEHDAALMRLRMAEALVRERSYDLALPYIKELLARAPRSSRLHLLLGIVLREKGVYDAAATELARALELDPRSAAAHTALGILRAKQGRLELAETHHRRAVALAPARGAYHNDLGFCLLLRRQNADARRAFAEAIRLDPSLRAAFNNLGFALGLDGDDEGAMRAFAQGGSRAMALTNMGFLEEMRGHPGSARRYYEQALRAKRDYGPALRNLRALDGVARTSDGGGP